MPYIYTLQLVPNVKVREDKQDILLAGPSGAALRLKRPGNAFRTLLERLARGGMDRNTLCDEAMGAGADDAGADLAVSTSCSAKSSEKGSSATGSRNAVTRSPRWNRRTGVSSRRHIERRKIPVVALRVSAPRCRHIVAECSLGHARVVIHDIRGGALVALLARHTPPRSWLRRSMTSTRLLSRHSSACSPTPRRCLHAQKTATSPRMTASHCASGNSTTYCSIAAADWGDTTIPMAERSDFSMRCRRLPAVRPPMSARRIALYKPDMIALEARDVPFST